MTERVLVIGAGMAGLFTALALGGQGRCLLECVQVHAVLAHHAALPALLHTHVLHAQLHAAAAVSERSAALGVTAIGIGHGRAVRDIAWVGPSAAADCPAVSAPTDGCA